MAKETKKAQRFKLTFPQKVLGVPIIHKLSQEFDVVPNILRGRIDENGAWLEIEILGSAKNVDRVLEYLRKEDVTIGPIEG